MNDVAEVMVQDESSGRIHKRFRIAGQKELAAFEADNADEAGAYVEIADPEATRAATPREAFCKRCFPELWAEDDGSTQPVETVP